MPDIEYIRQKIMEYDPTLDPRTNSVIADILVKPQAIITAPLANRLNELLNNQSILNYDRMSEGELDALMKNILAVRIQGEYSLGTVRIFFEEPADAVVNAGDVFISTGGLKFLSGTSVETTREIMSTRTAEDGLYYMDVPVVAERPGNEYEVDAGSITRMESPSFSYVKITNVRKTGPGRSKENNREFFTRGRESVTARNLLTDRGSRAVLPQVFPGVLQVETVGFNQPEMFRDVHLNHHFGGCTDFYIKTASTGTESEYIRENLQPEQEGSNPVIKVGPEGDITDVPLLRIKSVEIGFMGGGVFVVERTLTKGETLPDDTRWKYSAGTIETDGNRRINARYLRYSPREEWNIEIHPDHAGKSARIVYEWLPEIGDIQNYVVRSERIPAESMLVRSFIPAYVDMDIELELSPPVTEVPDFSDIIGGFIRGITVGEVIEISDIVSLLYENGARKVTLPVTASAAVHHCDGTEEVITSGNVLEVGDNLDKPVTGKIVRFFPGSIQVTAV